MAKLHDVKRIAAIDPGRDKCGMAVLAEDGKVLLQKVIETRRLEQELRQASESYAPEILLLGNGTTSGQAQSRIHASLPGLEVKVVDEYRTTEMAKAAYWKEHPPTGWRRILPTTMQVPPVPVDDFVAVILARRYLENGE